MDNTWVVVPFHYPTHSKKTVKRENVMGRPQNDVSLISERRIMFSLLDFFHLLHSLYWLICLPSHKGFHRLGVLLHLEGLCRLDLHLLLDSMLLLVLLLALRLLLLL